MSRALDRERHAQQHLLRLERDLCAFSGAGDDRHELRSKFLDNPSFRHVAADFALRAVYPQDLRLTPALSAALQTEVRSRMDVRNLPPLLASALAVHNALQPQVEETRVELTERWVEQIVKDLWAEEKKEGEDERGRKKAPEKLPEEKEDTGGRKKALEKLLEEEEEEK